MSTTLEALVCPECGCARVIDAARGPTCTACGLVIEETTRYVVHDPIGKEGIISSHAVLHGNTTTLVGKASERIIGDGARLSRIQQRAITYGDSKQSRVFHLVSGAVGAAQLPLIVADHAVHAARKIAALAPKGSSMAGCDMVAALAVFVACKKLSVRQTSDDVLGVLAGLGVDARLFKRNLLKLRALGKRAGRTTEGKQPVVNAALDALRDVLGPGDWLAQVFLVHARIAKALVGMRDDSAAAVTAYLAAQLVSPAGVPLTLLAKALRFRAASLYNAVKRVLLKVGVAVEGPMSRANVGAVLRARVLVSNGIMKEVPVAVAEVEPIIAPAAIEAEIDEPVTPASSEIVSDTIDVVPAVPMATTSHVPAPASARGRGRPRSSAHITIAPLLEFVAARGQALRSLDRKHRSRPVLHHQFGTVGPPIPLATGLGPPVPVAACMIFDGG